MDPQAIGSIVLGIQVLLGVTLIASMWTIFSKAGVPGWKALIPIYNFHVLVKLTGHSGWFTVMLFVPVANIYSVVKVYNGLAKSFGQGPGFTAGLIFLPIVFFPMLAFGKSTFHTSPVVPPPLQVKQAA